MKSIGERLREWRTAAGLSQEAAARALSVTTSAYQKWELGKREPQGEALERVETMLRNARAR